MSKKRLNTRRIPQADPAPVGLNASRHPWWQWLLVVATLVVITAAVYWQCIDGPFILDDNPKIVENPDIHSLRDLPRTLVYPYNHSRFTFNRNDPSRPLVYLTYALNYHFGTTDPHGYHVVNVLVHLLNVLLVFLLLYVISGRVFQRWRLFAPWCGAMLFALHPVNAGTVNYVFCRSDLLATGFMLSSLLLLQVRGRLMLPAYLFAMVAFAMALLCKQSAIVLPALALCLHYLVSRSEWRADLRAHRWRHVGLWALAAVYLLLRLAYFGSLGDMEARSPWLRGEYLAIQPYAILRYVQLLIAPIGLCVDHRIPFPTTFFEPRIILSLLAILGSAVLAYVLVRRSPISARLLSFAVLWGLITLGPTSSFFPTTSALVENRLYLPSVAFVLLLMALYFGIGTVSALRWRLATGFIVAHVIIFGVLTLNRCSVYRTPRVLWEEAVRLYPRNPRAHLQLGVLYLLDDERDKALPELETAVQLYPYYPDATYHLGVIYALMGRDKDAVKAYEQTLAIDQHQPRAINNLGVLYAQQGRVADAEKMFLELRKQSPDNPDAYHNLACLYMGQGRFAEAEKLLLKTLDIVPHYENAYVNLKSLYTNMGNAEKARWAEDKLHALQDAK